MPPEVRCKLLLLDTLCKGITNIHMHFLGIYCAIESNLEDMNVCIYYVYIALRFSNTNIERSLNN